MSSMAFAVTSPPRHPAQDQLDTYVEAKEKTFVSGFVNAFPIIGIPRVGESAKETIVSAEKFSLTISGALAGKFACTTTVTNNSTIIAVTETDYYIYLTQSIKMAPAGCALGEAYDYNGDPILDENGDPVLAPKVEGALAAGKKSRVIKRSIFSPSNVASVLANWTSWAIAGKIVKYTWVPDSDGDPSLDGFIITDSGSLNLGAGNILCSFATNLFTAKGSMDQVMTDENGDPVLDPDGNEITGTVTTDIKESGTFACGAPRPVFGKINTDIMSLPLNEFTEYCIDDEASDMLLCKDTREEHLDNDNEEIIPEQLIPLFPSLTEEP